jgi:hypothetical protein
MSGRATTILGIVSAAAVSIWIGIRRTRRVHRGYSILIDDDTAAEIIKRARPALERARALY